MRPPDHTLESTRLSPWVYTTMDYGKADELIRVGEEAAREALPQIQALLAPYLSS